MLLAGNRFRAEVLAHSRFSRSESSASGRILATASATSDSCFWTEAMRALSNCWSSVWHMTLSTAFLNVPIENRFTITPKTNDYFVLTKISTWQILNILTFWNWWTLLLPTILTHWTLLNYIPVWSIAPPFRGRLLHSVL